MQSQEQQQQQQQKANMNESNYDKIEPSVVSSVKAQLLILLCLYRR